MKKIFFAVLALAAMASCSKEYIVAENKQAIGFGEAFVDNSTRATDITYLDGKDVQSFKVWGTVTGTHTGAQDVLIFNGTPVTRPGSLATGVYDPAVAWVCDNVQYWVPNANYAFTAVVDGELNDDLTTIDYTVADQFDLLLATATAEVNNDGVVTRGTNANGLVAFTFDHLLSKAYFTFKTAKFKTDDYYYEISNIQFDNAYTEGTYTIGATTPWAGTTPDVLSFGATVAHKPSTTAEVTTTSELVNVFIPQQGVTVSFTVTIKYDVDANDAVAPEAISVKNYSFPVFKSGASEAGNSYNFVAEFTENAQIKFTVEDVTDWAVNNPTLDVL